MTIPGITKVLDTIRYRKKYPTSGVILITKRQLSKKKISNAAIILHFILALLLISVSNLIP